jgi:hypothetical protein
MPVAFFLQRDEPLVNLIDFPNVVGEQSGVGVPVNLGGFSVPLLHGSDDLIQLVYFAVHDPQVRDDANFFDSKALWLGGTRIHGQLFYADNQCA